MPTCIDAKALENSAIAAKVIGLLYDNESDLYRLQWARKGLGDFDRIMSIGGFRSVIRLCVLWKENGNEAVVCSTGVGFAEARQLMYGWTNSIISQREFGCNYSSAADVARLIPTMVQLGLGARELRVYGHSGGGALVECLALAWDAHYGAKVREIVTFGAPKAVLEGACVDNRNTNRIRWHTARDPVPFLPWSSAFGGSAIALAVDVANDGLYEPQRWRHGPGGVQIDDDATYEFSDQDWREYFRNRIDLVRWMAGLDGSPNGPHSMPTYIRRLFNADVDKSGGGDGLGCGTRPGGARPAPPTNFVMPFPMPPQSGDPITFTAAQVSPNGVSYAGEAIIHPARKKGKKMAFSKVAPRLKFMTNSLNGVYSVWWMDRLVFVTPSGGKARTIMRAGNRLLRVMGVSQQVSASAFGDSLADYLTAAAAAGGGVVPPLNVVA